MTRSSILVAGLITAGVLSPTTHAQDPPVNAELVGEWDGFNGSYADVWGEGDFAYVGHFGHDAVNIIDISDPELPVLASTYDLAAPDNGGSAQDVKVHDGIMYIGIESSTTGVQIVDVRDPFNPQLLTFVAVPNYRSIHNVFYSDGYLYMADSGSTRVGVIDLTDFDPDNAPEMITEAKWILEGVGSSFVHDVTVQHGRLYASAWDSGLWVYDITNVANEPPVFLGEVDGENTHSAWATDNGDYVVTGEERFGGGIRVFRITDDGDSLSFEETDEHLISTNEASSVHNQTIIGYRLYNSWYGAGLQVFDIDPETGLFEFFASYDSTGSIWGVYPFLSEDTVLCSDMSNGLLVINVDLTESPSADLDGDGDVDAADLAILLGAWGPCGKGECPADLDGDGDVDSADLAILLGAWT